jgi:hypothetical protein
MDYDWQAMLAPVSAHSLENADKSELDWLRHVVPNGEAMLASKWLGYPGATESQIVAAETRLGKIFPPDYRQFLALSNGWLNFREYPWGSISLLPVEEVGCCPMRSEKVVAVSSPGRKRLTKIRTFSKMLSGMFPKNSFAQRSSSANPTAMNVCC